MPKRPRFDFWEPSKTGVRRQPQAVKGGRKLRKSSGKAFTREIFVLPYEYLSQYKTEEGTEVFYKIPRGNMRQNLMLRGLTAKIAITKQQSEREVAVEISKLFKSCFSSSSRIDDELLQFHYLGSFPGTKLLKIPKVNNAFSWDGAAVLSLHKTTIYIAVSHKFKLCSELNIVIDVESDEENTNAALPSSDATIANDLESKQVCSADQ